MIGTRTIWIKAKTMKHTKQKTTHFLALLMIMALCLPLHAIASNSEELERYTNVKLVAEKNAVSPGETITIATEINLAPHWHIYWENPGDSGLPVTIKWDAPEGFEISDIDWPTPDKISYEILVNYGYYNQAILLQSIKLPETLPEGKIALTAEIDMLVCKEICIPESETVSINLNDPDNLNEQNPDYIQAAKTKNPPPIKGQFDYHEEEGALHLSLSPEDHTILNNATANNLEFFPLDWGIINHIAVPNVTIESGQVTIAHERGSQSLAEIKELKGLLVIKGDIGENKGFQITAQPKDKAQSPAVNINQGNVTETAPEDTKSVQPENKETKKITWFSAIYLALFGGIILNLMPCVFPVLSMKALSLAKMGDKEQSTARMHGIAYTLGIIISFLIIGGILIILKEAGAAIGWGFQLQSPIVIALLAYLLFAISLNLIGFFEFNFGLGNTGQKLTQGSSLSSSFFTGTLATIVATPCTAPFMGAAMGYAITQPPIVSLTVFAAIGLGLALPYLLLSFIPQTRTLLPKPGAWMNTFKQFLAFPMLASTIWLIWVLNQQSGSYGVLLILLGMLAISFSVWLAHIKTTGAKKKITHTLIVIFLLLPILSLAYIESSVLQKTQEASIDGKTFGAQFSPESLSKHLKGDQPIFVEMTAAWCITCKINHTVAINTNATKRLFRENNVQFLIGDWTNKDDTITKYLASFDRNGVPLYVFYGARDKITKKRPKPKILPQVLTPRIVKEMIEEK